MIECRYTHNSSPGVSVITNQNCHTDPRNFLITDFSPTLYVIDLNLHPKSNTAVEFPVLFPLTESCPIILHPVIDTTTF
jgi:hypothetical protein